jgi:maltooligosyltrehalose trehalohydrolase
MTARSAFRGTWGAKLDEDGTAVFRLWAPAVDDLGLRLGNRTLPMENAGCGWFELSLGGCREGEAYAFVLPDGRAVPDPASRAQASDVHGPSLLAGSSFDWKTPNWRGRPLVEVIIYELHVGAFSPEGTFDGVRRRLDRLAATGITAVELMPVAQFSGNRGWGYDGVLPYCAHRAYGGIQGLKRLVDAAHERGLMMILDVVYNHFGPDGNYLELYAPDFFDQSRHTPWGPGIRFEERAVRDFFCDNPLYWLEEFRFDGLRFDAIHQIADETDVPILEEIAATVRDRLPGRHVHLMTEDERNIVHLHPRDNEGRPRLFSAEWNDDVHHAAHCVATGERDGYYAGFADDAPRRLARALAEGFAYQGEPYAPWRGKPRGVPSAHLPPTAFIDFLQNHDQIGNRAFGERLTALADPETVELLTAVLLLNPQIPLLFMGEEYGEKRPFLYFTDFHGDLATAVREGRRREFEAFGRFGAGDAHRIPDPNAPATFEASSLDWGAGETEPGIARYALVSRLIALRMRHIVPRHRGMRAMQAEARMAGRNAFAVTWVMDGARLMMAANFGEDTGIDSPLAGFDPIYESRPGLFDSLRAGTLPAGSVCVAITRGGAA